MGFKVVSAMINCRGRARMAWGLRRGWWGGRTAAVMIRVTGALLSDAWAKTYEQVSKPRVGRVLTEMGGWSVWTAGQPMQLEQNGGDGREEKGTSPSTARRKASHAFFLLFSFSFQGLCVWERNSLLDFCVFHCCAGPTHLCQAYWALTSLLGNADSGSPLEKSISDKKGC